MLCRIIPTLMDVFKTPLGGDCFGRLKAGSSIRDESDAGDDLLVFHDQLIDTMDPLHTGCTIPKRGINTCRPQIRWFKHMGVGGKNRCGCHDCRLSALYCLTALD